MSEPSYYNCNGLSPLEAFHKGLMSRDEYLGFLRGNVIKYVVRCDKKGSPVDDLDKAIQYIFEMYYLLGSEEMKMDVEEFRMMSELADALHECECGGECDCE